MLKSSLVQRVFAATAIPVDKPVAVMPFGTVNELFTWVTNGIIIIGFGLVIVFLALGFIKFITSQGDKDATAQAQKWVSYAALGGVGLLAVYAIKAIIINLTGVSDPTEPY